MKKILRIADVLEMTGLNRSTLYRLVHLGKFPAGVKLSERGHGWRVEEVEKWIDGLEDGLCEAPEHLKAST